MNLYPNIISRDGMPEGGHPSATFTEFISVLFEATASNSETFVFAIIYLLFIVPADTLSPKRPPSAGLPLCIAGAM